MKYLIALVMFGFATIAQAQTSVTPFTGAPWTSYEVPANQNGNWLGSSTPNITYHSVAGDAVNHYFTANLIQFTSAGGSSIFESGLAINFTNQTGEATGPLDGNNGNAGILISGIGKPGGSQMWLQANDMILAPGWNGKTAYNTEIDSTNGSGLADMGVNLVLGGLTGSQSLESFINIFPGAPGPVYGAKDGIKFTGDWAVRDVSFYDGSRSNTSIRLSNNHATAIDLSQGNFWYAQVNGRGFTIDSKGAYNHPSDERLKNIDAPLDGVLSKLSRVQAYRFHWKDDEKVIPEQRGMADIGVIAQELEKEFPELVSTLDGIKHVNYAGLVVPLLASVQELSAEIKNLKKKVADHPQAR